MPSAPEARVSSDPRVARQKDRPQAEVRNDRYRRADPCESRVGVEVGIDPRRFSRDKIERHLVVGMRVTEGQFAIRPNTGDDRCEVV